MEFGFTVPVRGPGADPEGMANIAAAAESYGYSYIAVNDHVVVPKDVASLYPYTDDGSWPGRIGDFLDPLSLIGFLAGVTKKINLLTSVLVIPYRPPILAAKMIASLDVMSGGRLILGVGAGWMREEFEAVGAPDFNGRGKVTDEYIEAFRILWTEQDPRFHGEYVDFENIIFAPQPVQKNGPRIWVGGESHAARRRTAKLGDGWYPTGSNPKIPLDTLERYVEAQSDVIALAIDQGRDKASIDFAYWAMRPWTGEAESVAGDRRLFTGQAQDLIDDVKKLEDVGVSHLSIMVLSDRIDGTVENVKRFADEVMAQV